MLGTDESYFKQLPAELLAKKDRLAEILRDAGFEPIIPDGGYFMIADASNIGMMHNSIMCVLLHKLFSTSDGLLTCNHVYSLKIFI